MRLTDAVLTQQEQRIARARRLEHAATRARKLAEKRAATLALLEAEPTGPAFVHFNLAHRLYDQAACTLLGLA